MNSLSLAALLIVVACSVYHSSHAIPTAAASQHLPQETDNDPSFDLHHGLKELYAAAAEEADENDNDDDDDESSSDLNGSGSREGDSPLQDLGIAYDSLDFLLIPELLGRDSSPHDDEERPEDLALHPEDDKRAREFIGKRAREFIGKRAREFIGKRAREFIGKRAREFIGKRAREFIGKRAREFIGKRAREFIGKRAREFIGKRSEDVLLEKIRDNMIKSAVYSDILPTTDEEKRAREFIGKRAREFIGKRAREFIGKRAREFIGKRAREFIGKRAREFIGKRAREFIGKRAREFIGKRLEHYPGNRNREFIGKRKGTYKFDDGYLSGEDNFDGVDYPSENNLLSFLAYEDHQNHRGDDFLSVEAPWEEYSMGKEQSYSPPGDDAGFPSATKRPREFIGKRADFDMLVSKRPREFIGKRADFEMFTSKRPREFIGKRQVDGSSFGELVGGSDPESAVGVK